MRRKHKTVLLTLCLVMGSVTASGQSLAYPDSLRAEKEDTLREITIQGSNEVKLPMSGALKSQVQGIVNARKYSLSGILGETVTDYIMHPFGFAERKRAKKRKKVSKVLQQYDAITDPLQELLDSLAGAQVQGIEPKK